MPAQQAACGGNHTVARGGSFSAIALRACGNAANHQISESANAAQIGPNPALISDGLSFGIPCLDAPAEHSTANATMTRHAETTEDKTSVAAASRTYDLAPEDAQKGVENALKTNPLDVRQQYEKQLKDLQEAYGAAMLELRARKKYQALLDAEEVKRSAASSGAFSPMGSRSR